MEERRDPCSRAALLQLGATVCTWSATRAHAEIDSKHLETHSLQFTCDSNDRKLKLHFTGLFISFFW